MENGCWNIKQFRQLRKPIPASIFHLAPAAPRDAFSASQIVCEVKGVPVDLQLIGVAEVFVSFVDLVLERHLQGINVRQR